MLTSWGTAEPDMRLMQEASVLDVLHQVFLFNPHVPEYRLLHNREMVCTQVKTEMILQQTVQMYSPIYYWANKFATWQSTD